jgi:hypothetical protein
MDSIRVVRWGVVLALSSILFGFALGALFGLNEAGLKGHLESEGRLVLAEKYGGDDARLRTVLDKSWVYFQRAHLHGGGIGAVALGLCLLLAFLPATSARLKGFAGTCAGAGALGYSVFWLLAGLRAPRAGSTSAAKETLQWLAVPSSGLAIVGLILTFALAVRSLWSSAPTS